MRSAGILNQVHSTIYSHTLDYEAVEDRLNVQKTAYLLQHMGMPIGNYGFRWGDKHGPYSQSVQEDAYRIARLNPAASNLRFTKQSNQIIEKFKSYLNSNPGPYDRATWLEAIASLHYIATYIMPDASDLDVIMELVRRKPQLNDQTYNEAALEIAREIILGI